MPPNLYNAAMEVVVAIGVRMYGWIFFEWMFVIFFFVFSIFKCLV